MGILDIVAQQRVDRREAFMAFKRVKEAGYNMATLEAKNAVGVSDEEYRYIQTNYKNLFKEYGDNLDE